MADFVTSSKKREARPVFSICVPQYNRTSFLIEACKSLVSQTFTRFELCVSDDCSTDGRQEELLAFLHSSGLEFRYVRQSKNNRYDRNLRASIAMARGEFVLLMGNDDGLASPDMLERIYARIRQYGPVSVVITNYKELEDGRVFHRVPRTGVLGSGPELAARVFRNFSFVSGLILETEGAKLWATDKWDGSEMYQMYLGCRMLAAGGRCLAIDDVCVEKGIQIPAESVDSYASKRIIYKGFSPVVLPMAQIAPLVGDAVAPYLGRHAMDKIMLSINRQLMMFTYGFWLLETRRVHSWRYALAVYRGLRPVYFVGGFKIGSFTRAAISFLYVGLGVIGLTAPIGLFQHALPVLYRLAKRQ